MMDELAGKRLTILGLARQGTALARFAASVGASVTVSDLRPARQLGPAIEELGDYEIRLVLGEHPMSLLEETDVLAVSGGVPLDSPLVQAAIERGIPVTNDSYEFARRAPGPTIGITGSAGKTTTTALTGAMGQASGRRTWVGGNIGQPLIDRLPEMERNDVVVQELSSFQLALWRRSPEAAAVLNLTPNHLDRHRTMEDYVEAKANIIRYQKPSDVAMLNADDAGALALRPLVQGRLRLFSLQRSVEDGAFVRDGQIWLRDGERETCVCPTRAVRLRGQHNLANSVAAVALADSAGLPVEAMREAIATFRGVEHRLEFVAEIDGVCYVNDSIATAPERVLAALDAYEEPLVLLAGGRDKGMVWDAWTRRVQERVKTVILFGELAEMLAARLERPPASDPSRPQDRLMPEVIQVERLADAVAVARKHARPGDVVLLSPGGTSFDEFSDFAERGEAFRQLVGNRE